MIHGAKLKEKLHHVEGCKSKSHPEEPSPASGPGQSQLHPGTASPNIPALALLVLKAARYHLGSQSPMTLLMLFSGRGMLTLLP